jgi:glycosyltransferase involved in cell wall biosynthesis
VKQRVLVIGPTPPPYHGMTTATLAMLNSSLRDQFDLIHLDTSDRRDIENIGRWDWRNIRLALEHGAKFLWLLAVRRPHIVLVQLSQNRPAVLRDLLFLVPARLTGRHVVVHLNGGYFRQYYESEGGAMRALIRYALGRVIAVVVLGERFRPIFEGLVPSDRIFVVPNGLDANELFAIPRPNGFGEPHVFFLSNLVREKGFVDLVDAALPVTRAIPNVRFTIGGAVHDTPAHEDARRIVDQRNLDGHVVFPGALSGAAKHDAFSRASLFVLPSCYPFEGQPYVILEAMAAGLPVVTTDQGVIGDTVQDGVNGFIVPARDPDALAEKIILLLRDKALRERMGQIGRDLYQQRYTLERWIERMGSVIRRSR